MSAALFSDNRSICDLRTIKSYFIVIYWRNTTKGRFDISDARIRLVMGFEAHSILLVSQRWRDDQFEDRFAIHDDVDALAVQQRTPLRFSLG